MAARFIFTQELKFHPSGQVIVICPVVPCGNTSMLPQQAALFRQHWKMDQVFTQNDGKTATHAVELPGSGLKMPVVRFLYVPRNKSQ
jgi:hypothetical protein